jgi:hypothetical protein
MSDSNITLKQHYINLFSRLKNILIKPADEWVEIHKEDKDINDILSGFSLPLIGLCTFATFINFTFNRQSINFELALKHSAIVFTALFGGLYLTYLALIKINATFKLPDSKQLAFRLSAYSSGLLYVVTFITSLVPELFFLYMATLYSVFIVWQGVLQVPGIKQEQILTISLIIAFMIHFIPFFVKFFLIKLITF